MKLHLPLSLRSALLAVCALLPASPASALVADVGSYYYHRPSGTHWELCSYWARDYVTHNEVRYYDRITIGYQHAFQVSSNCVVTEGENVTTHAVDVHAFLTLNENGGGKDYTAQCSTYDDAGNLVTPGVWILANSGMETSVTLTNYDDILISDSRQQYYFEDVYKEEDVVKYKAKELWDFSESSPTVAAECGAQIHQVGFTLTVTDTNSFTYQNAYTASTGSFQTIDQNAVLFDGVKNISFLNNHAVNEGGVWLMDSGASSITITNAENVTFSGNCSDVQGSIAWANQWTAPVMTFSNISGKLLFDGNGGNSLFRNVSTIFTNVANLEFSNNKTDLWIAYNSSYDVRITDCDTVLFKNNGTGTRSDVIYDSGKDIDFLVSDCVDVRFVGNEVASNLFSSNVDGSSAVFTNNGSILFEGNRSTSGNIIAGRAPAFHGVNYWGAVGNHGVYSVDGNDNAALFSFSASVYGGTWDAEANAWASGRGELFEIRDNTATGALASVVSTETVSVYHFDKAAFIGNSVSPLVDGESILSVSDFSGVLSRALIVDDVNTLEIKGNSGEYTNVANNLVFRLTLSDFNTAEVSGNVMTGKKARVDEGSTDFYGILGSKMSVTGRVDANGNPLSSFTISGNTLKVDSISAGSHSTDHSLSNLKTFTYSDNLLEATTGEALSYLGGMPQLTNVETVVATGNILRTGATVGDSGAYARGAVFSGASTDGACFDGVKSMTLSSNVAGGLVSAENPHAMAYKAYGGVIDMVQTTSKASFQNVGNIRIDNNEVRGSSDARGGFMCINGYVVMAGTGGELSMLNNHAYTLAGGTARGGALYISKSYDSTFSNFGSISIRGNSAELLGAADPENAAVTRGGAIYMDSANSSLAFTNNDSLVVRGNYCSDGTTVSLNSIYQYYTSSKLNISNLSGQTAEFYDSMTVGTLTIGTKDATSGGSVLFSGKYTEEDLAAIKPGYTEEELAASRQVSAYKVQVYSGTLTLADDVHLNVTYDDADGTMKVSGSAAAMNIKGASVESIGGVYLSSGARMSMSDASSLTSTKGWVELYGGSQMEITGGSSLTLSKNSLYLDDASGLLMDASTFSSYNASILGASSMNLKDSTLTVRGELKINEASQGTVVDSLITTKGVVTLDDADTHLRLDHSTLDTSGSKLNLTAGAALTASNGSQLTTGLVTVYGSSSLSLENTTLDATEKLEAADTASVSLKNVTLTTSSAVNILESATLEMRDSAITALSFNPYTATFTGVNTVSLSGVGNAVHVYNKNAVWTFNLSVVNLERSVLTIDFTVDGCELYSKGQSLVLTASGTLAAGEYRLLTFANEKSGSLTFLDTMSISGLVEQSGVTADPQSSVYYVYENQGTCLTLMYKIESPEIVVRQEPATLFWSAPSGTWTTGAGLAEGTWAGDVTDLNYYDGDTVVFDTASEVELSGTIMPADVYVSNESGTVRLHGDGQIVGSSALIKTGDGTLRMETTNTYEGDTILVSGTLELGNAHALGLGGVLLNGGTLDMGSLGVANWMQVNGDVEILGASAFEGELIMTGGSLSGDAINLAQDAYLVDGVVASKLTGEGYVWVAGEETGVVKLNAANSYKGGTVIESGTLELGHATALGTGHVFLDSASLDMNGNAVANDITVEGDAHIGGGSAYAGQLSMVSGSLSGDAIRLSQDAELESGTINAALTGTAGLTKTGTGTVTLAGKNTYTGLTSVDGGTLVLSGSVAGDISVAGGAILSAATPLCLGNQTLSLAKGAKVTGNVSMAGSSTLEADGGASISGTLTLDGGVLRLSSVGLSLGKLVTGENVTLLSVDGLSSLKNGSYKLLSYQTSSPDADMLQLDVANISDVRPAWALTTNNKAVTLVVNSTTQTLTWNAQTKAWGLGLSDARWTTRAADKSFYNGDKVVFGMAADVNLTTAVAPGSITVQGRGNVTIDGAGSIGGEGALTMKSSGTLTLETANSYTGGTTISSGTVVLGDEAALGSGAVTLKGGTLDLNGHGISNELLITGKVTLAGADAYDNSLTVTKGTLTLLSDVAGDIELAKSASLARKENSKDKQTSTLTLASGKTLSMGSGAKLQGSLDLSSGQSLIATGRNSISETLTLAGGTINFGAAGLKVKALDITGETDVEVENMLSYKKGSHKLISYTAKNITPDVSALVLDTTEIEGSRMEGSTLSLGKNAVMLNITESCAKLSWKSDEAGTWAVQSGSEWIAKKLDDNHFYQGDHVTLTKGELTLEGSLRPGSITVNAGAKDSVTLGGTGSITGNTSLKMTGRGKLIINNANSYEGGTIISAGSVTLGDADALGVGGIELKGGALDLGGEAVANDITVSRNATLEGAESFAGALILSGGTLKGGDVNLAQDATVMAGSIMNNLVGDGGLIKTGKGTATLAGNNTYTGLTDVQAGTLTLKGSLAGSIRLADKTKLNLTNSSKSLSLGSSQSLTLGSGAKVTGSVSMSSGSYLYAGSKSSISGTLTLGGGTFVFEQMGVSVGKLDSTSLTTLDISSLTIDGTGTYQLLTYRSQTVDMDDLQLQWAADSEYSYDLILDKKALKLVVSEATVATMSLDEDEADTAAETSIAVASLTPRNTTSLTAEQARRLAVSTQLSANQRSVYAALCAVADSGQGDQALAQISADVAASNDLVQLRSLLDSLSGAQYATAMSSQIEGNLSHLRMLGSRVGSGQALQGGDGRLAAYVGALSSNTSIDADAAGYGYTRHEWGGQIGGEYRVNSANLFGLAVSESLARITPTSGKRAEETRTSVDLYSLNQVGSWSFRTMAGAGLHRHAFQQRDIMGYVPTSTGKTHLDGYSFNFAEDISYTVRLSDEITLQPFARVESSFNHIDSFRESGYGSLSLCGDDQQAWATDLTLGLRYNQQFQLLGNAPQALFSAHVGTTASVGDTREVLRLHFVGMPGIGFEQSSAKRNRWAMSLGAGLNVPVSESTSLYATVDALLRGDSSSVDAQMGVQIAF